MSGLVSAKDIAYAQSLGLPLWFNGSLAVANVDFSNYDDELYMLAPEGTMFIADMESIQISLSTDKTKAYFARVWWQPDGLSKLDIQTEPYRLPITYITQRDIDYAAINELTLMFNDRVAKVGDNFIEGTRLSLKIDNGIFLRVEIPSDPFLVDYIKPSISPDSKTVHFRQRTWTEDGLTLFEFVTRLTVDTPKTSGINQVYTIKETIVRSVITDYYYKTKDLDSSLDPTSPDLSSLILGLVALPFPIEPSFVQIADDTIKYGRYTTPYTGDLLSDDVVSINIGEIIVPEINKNLLDYKNKVAILHLPYCDSFALDIDYVVGATISVNYDINLYNGQTVVTVSSSKLGSVIETKYIDIDIKVPFGNPVNAPPAVDVYNISIGGDNGVRRAFIEILTNEAVLADGFFTIPVVDEDLIGTNYGFVRIEDVELTSRAKADEKREIISLLEDGIIINGNRPPPVEVDPVDPELPPEPVDPNKVSSVGINGIVKVGNTLSAIIVDLDGVPDINNISHVWSNGSGVIGFGSTYTIKTSDIGKQIAVKVSFIDNKGFKEDETSKKTIIVPDIPIEKPPNVPATVAIFGTVKVGNVLTSKITDPNGFNTVTYEWSSSKGILGSLPTYLIDETDIGTKIKLTVLFVDNEDYPESVTAETEIVSRPEIPNNLSTVKISGVVEAGLTVAAIITDIDGVQGAVTYRWYTNNEIVETNVDNAMYLVKSIDANKALKVTTSYVDSRGFNEIATSPSITVPPVVVAPPNINGYVDVLGDTTVGEVLSVKITDPNGVPELVKYTWFLGADIVATSKTYTLSASDVGKRIMVRVEYLDGDGYNEYINSVRTDVIKEPYQPNIRAKVHVEGTYKVGELLTAVITDPNGLPPESEIEYIWLMGGEDIGNTKTYLIKPTDFGRIISLRVAFRDTKGYIESASNSDDWVWSPANLFGLNVFAKMTSGVFYDPNVTISLYKDVQGLQPVTSDGDKVALMKDLSGHKKHAVQPDTLKRPVYRTNGTTAWLDFDGVNDFMNIPTNVIQTNGVNSILVGFSYERKTGSTSIYGGNGKGYTLNINEADAYKPKSFITGTGDYIEGNSEKVLTPNTKHVVSTMFNSHFNILTLHVDMNLEAYVVPPFGISKDIEPIEPDTFTLFSDNNTGFSKGKFHGLVIYDTELSNELVGRISDYFLNTQYVGMQITPMIEE